MTTQLVDVSSRESVRSLAEAAAALGDVLQLVQAAGLSPAMAPPEAVLKVDLFGTALVLEEFGRVIPTPIGVSIFPFEPVRASRRWLEARHDNPVHYRQMPAGGHFAALEQPAALVEEIRTTFRGLR